MSEFPFKPSDILEELFHGVYCVDRRRKILYWNRAAARLTGYEPEEMVGRACPDSPLCHTDEDGNYLCRAGCPLSTTMASGKSSEKRVFLRHRDGHRVAIRVRTSPLRDESGRVVGGVESFVDDSASVDLEERVAELETLAAVDPLTSLSNRRHALQQLESKHNEWQRYGWPYGILLLDIDHFKQVNDTWGHDAGDRALVSVARTLTSKTRASDLVSRWGGEEFLVLARCSTQEQLSVVAESLRGLVASARFRATEEELASVTVSIGGALASAGDAVEDVIKRSDSALYEAKRSGRNRFIFRPYVPISQRPAIGLVGT